MIKAQVDTRRATDALWELQRATKKPIAEILKIEVQAVLQLAMDRTRAASLAALKRKIEQRVRRSLYGRTGKGARVSVNIKQNAGRAWYLPTDGGRPKMMNDGTYRHSDEDYADFLTADFSVATPATVKTEVDKIMKKEAAEFRKRRGIAKQTWLLIAQQFGMFLRAPQYVQQAEIPGIDNSSNVRARIEESRSRMVYEGRNSSPVANSYGARGKAAIQSALSGRQRLIRDALAGGMGRAAQALRRKYGLG